MSTARTIIIGGAVYGAFWLFQHVKAANMIEYNFESISFEGTVLNPQLNITFNVINRSDYSITVKGLSGDIYLNNEETKIGEVRNFVATDIKSKEQTNLTLPVDIIFNGISLTISDLIANNFKDSLLIFNGKVTIDGLPLPLNLKYRLS